MLTQELLVSSEPGELELLLPALGPGEVALLVDWLSLKEDTIRYRSFLLLQALSKRYDLVYPYWDALRSKLNSDNSYQRSIGLMLLAENARWDREDRLRADLGAYLGCLSDEKPITVRQCIQALAQIVPAKPELCPEIAARLIALPLAGVRETMRKLILQDILNILLLMRNTYQTDETEGYILSALSGEILDKKTKKEIRAALSAG